MRKNRVRITAFILMLFCLLASADLEAWGAPRSGSAPGYVSPKKEQKVAVKHIIVLLGDGMGSAQRDAAQEVWQAANGAAGKLIMNDLPIQNTVSTASYSGITDSLAADSALLTGQTTWNGTYGINGSGQSVPDLFMLAQKRNWSTAVVTNACISDIVKNAAADRSGTAEETGMGILGLIARQPGGQNRLDFMMLRTVGKPSASINRLLSALPLRFAVAARPDAAAGQRYFGQIIPVREIYEIDQGEQRDPGSLSLMTETALARLDQNPNGFFLLVHSASIDRALHRNDLAAAVSEVQYLDRTAAICHAYYEKHRQDTVMVVIGDHETGGLSLSADDRAVRVNCLRSCKASLEKTIREAASSATENGPSVFINNGYASLLNGNGRSWCDQLKAEKKTDKEKIIAAGYRFNGICGIRSATRGHTQAPMPVSAEGPGTEAVKNAKTNADIGRLLIKMVQPNL